MSEETKKEPIDNISNGEDFNRTVVVSKPGRRSGSHSTPLNKIAKHFAKKKQEVEDIIGGMNISQYTDTEPDTTAQLEAPLSHLHTRYSVLEEFAQGGHATVSIARNKNLRRIVAIKSLKQEAEKHSEIVDSFVAEAKVTAQLDHPAIIPIYGLTGDDHHGVHMSMKLVNGKTLRDYLRNLTLNYRIRGIKTFDEAALLRKRLEIFLRVCDAIAYAHSKNIIHRDLKPENIMLGEYMEVYVMDWGLAKAISKDDPTSGDDVKLTGTPRYFSPEALRGDPCDTRADIFTLGLILQEIVTLQFAVRGKDEKEFMERIVNGELEPIKHQFGWRIDRPLREIIRKATAYRISDRYQSVEELSEDLRRYMGGLSVSVLPDNLIMKIGRFAYHWRKEFIISIMALLFGFTAVTAYAIYRQLQTTKEMNLQRRAINFCYNRMGMVSDHLNLMSLHIQEQLSALARITAYLFTYNTDARGDAWTKNFRPTMTQIGKTEIGMFYSPYYKRMTSLDYGIYTLAPSADQAQCEEFMRRVYPVLVKMKIIVLGNRSGYSFAPEDYEKLKAEYLYKGSQIRSVYIGTESGLKLLYPWRGNYSRTIDPRKQSWYQEAKAKNGPVWGKPYMDADSVSGLSIPCSVPICDLHGKFRGVAGLDVSINNLTTTIINQGNTGDYVLEKAIIDQYGEVVFSTKSKFVNRKFDPTRHHQNTEFKMPFFHTKEVRDRIVKKGKTYGTFTVELPGGKSNVYSFAHLNTLNMYYVVVADYDKLIRYIQEHDL
ncbi:MAG: protein kinase [Lentisphaeria bacterium]|nr:protein kinase [Lentisphaeria bacterium]